MQINGFYELSQHELYAVDGGMPFLVGILVAVVIIAVVAVAVAGAVVLVGKAAQALSDWIG